MAERDGAAVDVQAVGIDRQQLAGRRAPARRRLRSARRDRSGRASARSASGPSGSPAPGRCRTAPARTPAVAKATKRASGVRPRSRARAADITTTADAPSLVCEELPAVTVPSARNAGRSLASACGRRVAPRSFVDRERIWRVKGGRESFALRPPETTPDPARRRSTLP